MLMTLTLLQTIQKNRLNTKILNHYYPKNIYEPQARREMKAVITQFNDVFYTAYPEQITHKSIVLEDEMPETHRKKHAIQKEMTVYKAKKIRKKELLKIESLLDLKYIAEEQILYMEAMQKKAIQTRQALSVEPFSAFFPQLYESRMDFLQEIEETCQETIQALKKEHLEYDRLVYQMVHYPDNLLKEASRFIGGVLTDSMKHVAHSVQQSIRKKDNKR